jgi:hypothetical protein
MYQSFVMVVSSLAANVAPAGYAGNLAVSAAPADYAGSLAAYAALAAFPGVVLVALPPDAVMVVAV